VKFYNKNSWGANMDRKRTQKEMFGDLMAKAWKDEAFKAKLLADPVKAMLDEGIPVPPGVKIQMHENTENVTHFVLPPKPLAEISDEQLERIAGGSTGGCDWADCAGQWG
jgi:hypothetical protein